MNESVLFTTDRLYARRLSAMDAQAMIRIFGDPESMRFVGDGGVLDEAECLHWVDVVTARNFETRGYGLIGLFDPGSEELVACAGIFHPGQQEEPELMYYLERSRWGQGYATEMVTGLLVHARTIWKVGRIIATISPVNTASQRVVSKCGFVQVQDKVDDDGAVTQIWQLLG